MFDEEGGATDEAVFDEDVLDEAVPDETALDEAGLDEAALGDVFEVVFEDAGFEALCCEDGEGRDEDVPREASDVSLNEKTELVLTEPDALAERLADVLNEPLVLSVPERDRLTGAVLLSE